VPYKLLTGRTKMSSASGKWTPRAKGRDANDASAIGDMMCGLLQSKTSASSIEMEDLIVIVLSDLQKV